MRKILQIKISAGRDSINVTHPVAMLILQDQYSGLI